MTLDARLPPEGATTQPQPAAPTTIGPWRTRVERWLSTVLATAAVGLLPVAAATTDLGSLGGLGLASALSGWAWLAVLAATGACIAEICRHQPRPGLLTALTGVLILCTTGLPSVVEPAARLTISWLHGGFVEAIAGDGTLPTNVDSRFSWAAFFAQWAWIKDAAGGHRLDAVLRWAPPAIVAIWATGVYAIARPLLGSGRWPWVAVWVFCGANWIEQDYFSPQATAILLVLAVLACVLGPLAAQRGDAAGLDRWPGPRPRPRAASGALREVIASVTAVRRPDLPSREVLLLWAVCALCALAVVVSHQLTPFALGAQLFVLALGGRFWGRWLLVLLVVAELTWFVLGAREFWIGQLALATQDIGDVGGSLQSALLDRVRGDPGQVAVKLGRIGLTLGLWALALAGAWSRWRRHREVRLLLLAAVPIGLVLLQSYGGEILLRVLLFGLPLLAVLATVALREFARRRPSLAPWAFALVMLLVFPLLVTLRGGNEAYSAVRPDQVAFVRQVLAGAQPGDQVLGLLPQGPLRLARVDELAVTSTEGCQDTRTGLSACVLRRSPEIILVLPQMDAAGVALDNRQPGWTRAEVARLVSTGRYRVEMQDGLTAVLVRTPVRRR